MPSSSVIFSAFGGFVAVFAPDVIVVDGELGPCGPAVVDGISSAIALRTQPMIAHAISVRLGELGDRAGLAGAVANAHAAWVRQLVG